MIGTSVAQYEITALLGAGGMGEVYEATDTRLGRRVAIKVLPDAFAGDGDRMARLEREARILASLSHPYIAAVYGLERAEGQILVVMELVPGETLADRITGRALPVGEALSIAAQIAAALESAHDAGVIHRDLKPSNIKLTPDSHVKLLDFGLAKTLAAEPQPVSPNSPTLSAMATSAGLILGTAAYMSPEQAKGRATDRRADIFAFGCVLYEMLTGRPAFEGETVGEVLARVLEREPDWSRLPPTVPPRIHDLLKRCVAKDYRKRQRDCGDVRLEIEQVLAQPLAAAPLAPASLPRRHVALAWVLVALLGVALAVTLLGYLRSPGAPEMRVDVATPPTADPFSFALSPDGRHLVFVASGDGPPRLWLRTLDRAAAVPLPGTEEARYPFWSPDSRSIGFFTPKGLLRTDIGGGLPRRIADAAPGMGGAWGGDGSILFAPTFGGPLFRVAAEGGEAVALTEVDPARHVSHRFPRFLPGGRQFMFYAVGTESSRGIYLSSLEDPANTRRLTDADATGVYVPSGWLLFVQQGTLTARPFDPDAGELSGNAVRLAETVGVSDLSLAALTASATGLVAFRASGDTRTRLTWFDRQGRPLGTFGPPEADNLFDPQISPDGTRVAVSRTTQGNIDVWIVDAARLTRFTSDPATDRFPVWSPDGARLAFGSSRNAPSDLYEKSTSGRSSEALLLSSPLVKNPSDWSRDGRFLLYFNVQSLSPDLWVLPLEKDAKPFAWIESPFAELWGTFSPDGRWVAYHSDESGARWEVYARPFPGPGGSVPISTAGGVYPRWSPDGTDLYYIAPDGMLMAVPIAATGASLEAGAPSALFPMRVPGGGANVIGRRAHYDVASDGRFLVNVLMDDSPAPPITLLLNWQPR